MYTNRRLWWIVTACAVFAGLALRFYDITEPPLDFYVTRQYQALILARSYYLKWRPGPISLEEREQRAAWIRVPRYEPPLLPMLVARTYILLGYEAPWVIRVYNGLFWLAGAVGLVLVMRRMHPHPAAWTAALTYWMLLPFGIQVTRAFLPDPLMTALLVWTAYLWHRAHESRSPIGYGLAALVGAAAAVVKIYALFFLAVLPPVLAWVAGKRPWRPALWWLAWIFPLPVALAAYLRIHTGEYSASFLAAWTLKVAHWWHSPMPYGGWMDLVNQNLHGAWVVVAALALVLRPRHRTTWGLMAGWFVGYLVFGLVFLLQYATHAYYHLPLLPWVAWGLGLATGDVAVYVARLPRWQQVLAGLAVLPVLVYPVGITYWNLASVDYRPRVDLYRRLGQELPKGKIMALAEGYGYPLLYYGGVTVTRWPTEAHALIFGTWDQEFVQIFRQRTREYDYFLVTDFEEFWRQEPLRRYLFAHYPLVHFGGDYLLWDLQKSR